MNEAVKNVLKMWEEKAIYDNAFLNGLKSTFARPKEFSLEYVGKMNEEMKNPEKSKNDPESAYIFPKLAEVEEYLREQYQNNNENLEKKCKQNGVSLKGSFDEIITRMMNLEYQILKKEYEELKQKENETKEKHDSENKIRTTELENQIISLRNKLIEIQKLHLSIKIDTMDGEEITQDDINLLDLPKDILQERKFVGVGEQEMEDTIDGQELNENELKFLEGHENEIFITIDINE